MPRVELGGGAWAEMRDLDDLRRADIRAVFKAADDDGVSLMTSSFPLAATSTMQEALVVRFVRRWSLCDGDGNPLPVTLDTVRDMPQRQYRPLGDYVQPALAELFGEQAQEAASPSSTAPSSTSASTG